jgi:hypothetical protein
MARRAMARQRKGQTEKARHPLPDQHLSVLFTTPTLRSPPVWVTPSQHTHGALAPHPTPMDGTAAQSEPQGKQPHTLTWRRTHMCISKSKVGLQVGRQATQALCGAGRLASPEMCSVGRHVRAEKSSRGRKARRKTSNILYFKRPGTDAGAYPPPQSDKHWPPCGKKKYH